MARLSLILCLGLVAAVAAEVHYGTLPEPVGDVVGPEPIKQPEPIPQFALAPIASLGETVSRPLFMSTRRPPEPKPPPTAPVAAPSPPKPKPTAPNIGAFVLSAVVITEGEKREAILRNPKTGKEERIQEGATIADWTLKEVRDDAVTLAWNDETQDVALRTFKAPPKPRPAATQAAARLPNQQGGVQRQPPPQRRQLTPAQRKRLEELRKRRRERRAALQQRQQQGG